MSIPRSAGGQQNKSNRVDIVLPIFYHDYRQKARKGGRMEKERSIPEEDITVSYYRASGAGGQKRDKTETAVRIHHLPTGIIVTASESRSRTINERRAMERLRERLAARNRKPRPRIRTRPGRAAKERRIQEKKHRSEIKKKRGKVED